MHHSSLYLAGQGSTAHCAIEQRGVQEKNKKNYPAVQFGLVEEGSTPSSQQTQTFWTMVLFFFFEMMRDYIYLFIYFWLHWIFVALRRLSLVAVSGGYSSLRCAGFSLQWLLLLRSTGSRCVGFSSCGTLLQQLWHVASVVVARMLQSAGSVVVAHGLSCSTACGTFSDQGLKPGPLHWQVDS